MHVGGQHRELYSKRQSLRLTSSHAPCQGEERPAKKAKIISDEGQELLEEGQEGPHHDQDEGPDGLGYPDAAASSAPILPELYGCTGPGPRCDELAHPSWWPGCDRHMQRTKSSVSPQKGHTTSSPALFNGERAIDGWCPVFLGSRHTKGIEEMQSLMMLSLLYINSDPNPGEGNPGLYPSLTPLYPGQGDGGDSRRRFERVGYPRTAFENLPEWDQHFLLARLVEILCQKTAASSPLSGTIIQRQLGSLRQCLIDEETKDPSRHCRSAAVPDSYGGLMTLLWDSSVGHWGEEIYYDLCTCGFIWRGEYKDAIRCCNKGCGEPRSLAANLIYRPIKEWLIQVRSIPSIVGFFSKSLPCGGSFLPL